MAHTAKSKKEKGVRLENKIVELIKAVYGNSVTAKRMPKSGQLQDFKSDIFTNLPISIEAKNQENWKILEWWKQCNQDALKDNKFPVLVISKNRLSEPLAVLTFTDLLILMHKNDSRTVS